MQNFLLSVESLNPNPGNVLVINNIVHLLHVHLLCTMYIQMYEEIFIMKAKTLNPDETARLWEPSDLSPYCLQYRR